jgi:hypothetical protein
MDMPSDDKRLLTIGEFSRLSRISIRMTAARAAVRPVRTNARKTGVSTESDRDISFGGSCEVASRIVVRLNGEFRLAAGSWNFGRFRRASAHAALGPCACRAWKVPSPTRPGTSLSLSVETTRQRSTL